MQSIEVFGSCDDFLDVLFEVDIFFKQSTCCVSASVFSELSNQVQVSKDVLIEQSRNEYHMRLKG